MLPLSHSEDEYFHLGEEFKHKMSVIQIHLCLQSLVLKKYNVLLPHYIYYIIFWFLKNK